MTKLPIFARHSFIDSLSHSWGFMTVTAGAIGSHNGPPSVAAGNPDTRRLTTKWELTFATLVAVLVGADVDCGAPRPGVTGMVSRQAVGRALVDGGAAGLETVISC